MDSYVVRIYRRPGRRSRILIGTVEVAGTEKKLAFSNVEELWEILRRPKRRRQRLGNATTDATAVAVFGNCVEEERKA